MTKQINWDLEQKIMKGIKRIKYREKLLISFTFIATDLLFLNFLLLNINQVIPSDGNGLLFAVFRTIPLYMIIICDFRWGFSSNLYVFLFEYNGGSGLVSLLCSGFNFMKISQKCLSVLVSLS